MVLIFSKNQDHFYEVIKMLLESALLCLSLNVYFESRGEPINGQKAVASVTFNRAKQNQKKVCEEVYKPNQFSWTRRIAGSGSISLKNKRALKHVKDDKAWKQAKNVARKVLSGKHRLRKVTYFHSKKVRPQWSRSKNIRLVTIIGNHKFYKEVTRG